MSSPTYFRFISLLLLAFNTTATLSRTSPLSVYLYEGFNNPGIPAGWTLSQVNGTTSSWSVVGVGTHPPIAPYAGSGQAEFNSYDAATGHQSRLTSIRTNLSGAIDPFLNFSLHHDDEFQSSLDSLYVEATTGDSIAGPWTTLARYCRPQSISAWKPEVISLMQYSSASRLFVSFHGVSQYGNNIHIDEVRIADSSFHDIGIASSSPSDNAFDISHSINNSRLPQPTGKSTPTSHQPTSPMVLKLAATLNVEAVVLNYGTFSESSYQVHWQIDGQTQSPVNNTGTLQRNGRDTLTLSWLSPIPGTHLITAWTSLNTDSNRVNDSLRVTMVVLDSTVFFAEMFNGTIFPPSGWSVINRDGGTLLPWFRGSTTSTFVPFEGTGFAADNFQRANGTYIDDYLITPPISNIGQGGSTDSLRFWARSASNPPPATNYPDSLMVLVSTTGPDTSNFTILLDYFSVPKTGWIQKQYSLTNRVPANSTIRLAFRYLHYNGGQSGLSSDFVGIDFVNFTRSLPTGVGETTVPSSFLLLQNFPNPFNPSTEIDFSVDLSGGTTLDLYNVLGEKVMTLFHGNAEQGIMYRVHMDGSHLASGVYFYRLQNGAKTQIKKLALQK